MEFQKRNSIYGKTMEFEVFSFTFWTYSEDEENFCSISNLLISLRKERKRKEIKLQKKVKLT